MDSIAAFPDAIFKAGGTLPADHPTYIERVADRELREALLKGEFCYVLDSRQVGKSSLMVRTSEYLRQQGARVAQLDLQQAGQTSPTIDQWVQQPYS
jgi:AAA-like domain